MLAYVTVRSNGIRFISLWSSTNSEFVALVLFCDILVPGFPIPFQMLLSRLLLLLGLSPISYSL